MNISKSLYVFLIILFIIILIIVIFKSILPLIGAGIEVKGYIGNLKGNFDIEIVNNNSYMPSEHHDSPVNSMYMPSEENNEDIHVNSMYMPSEENNEDSQVNSMYMPSDEDTNIDEYLNVIEEEVNDNLIFNSYIPLNKLNDYDTELSNMSLHGVFRKLPQPSVSPPEIMNKLSISGEENIIESFDSVDGYDNPVFVMFYMP